MEKMTPQKGMCHKRAQDQWTMEKGVLGKGKIEWGTMERGKRTMMGKKRRRRSQR